MSSIYFQTQVTTTEVRSWSSVQNSMDEPVMELKLELLWFLSGSLKEIGVNWSVPERELFPIVLSMTCLYYLMLGHVVHVFTDHVNFLTLYDPYCTLQSIPMYAVNKLMGWAIRLSALNYIIDCIPEWLNHWAYILSRWPDHYHTKVRATNVWLQ